MKVERIKAIALDKKIAQQYAEFIASQQIGQPVKKVKYLGGGSFGRAYKIVFQDGKKIVVKFLRANDMLEKETHDLDLLAATGSSYEKNCYRDPLYSLPKNQSFKEHEKDIRRIIKFIGSTSPYDMYISPAYAEFNGFPPMLIQCREAETSESDNDILYEKALKGGVKVKMT
ncbi:MAG: hypothetical protein HFE27_00105 [Clostridia bacterium]|jgi:hypothetical protein|nr:hypothetical protein [Clostridia bacterium]